MLPAGCFPTMITPMTAEGQIDWPRVDAITEWYIESGCTGLFANCLSSEMFQLTDEEQYELTKRVYEKAAGRVVVVSSGTGLDKTPAEQAAHIRRIAEVSDAVVIVVNQLASEDEDDAVWKARAEALLEATHGVRLGLYECPKPYHRLLTPELLAWAASTGRFLFHKDTCRQRKPIAAKLEATRDYEDFRFYNANVATLLFSLHQGAAGFSGISANFYPHLLVWLTQNPKDAHAQEVQYHLSVFENVVADAYPTSAKYYQSLFKGFGGSSTCRIHQVELNEEQQLKLEALHETSTALCKRIGIKALSPAMFL